MKIAPYLSFAGNCADAVTFYESVFGVKAQVMRYKEVPPEEGYKPPEGTENYIMHASLALGGVEIYLCDMPSGGESGFGSGMSIMLTLDTADALTACFGRLKEGGEVSMEPQKTFWSERFGMVTDKFDVSWMLSV